MKQILIHLAEGFEEIEAITIIDVLRRAGLNVNTVSVTGNLMVKGAHKIEVKADRLFEDVDYSTGMMIVLPGGMPGAKNLNEHKELGRQIIEYHDNDKYLAAICAAPLVFGNLGILKGKRAVCYPGFETQLTGAKVGILPYMVDKKVITGRGIGAALQFSLEIVKILIGEEQSVQLKKDMLIE
ncbi:MAG: DJ-1 family glyoxalase III [Mariniphaga sp.]